MTRIENKLLSAGGYIFFAPALYVILTEKRRNAFCSLHSAQALLLWLSYAAIYIALRVSYSLLSAVYYFPAYDVLIKISHLLMWFYAVRCGFLVFSGKDVTIPNISDAAKNIA